MIRYLSHTLRAKGPDRVHSPFVFSLYYYTLRDKNQFYCFEELEKKAPTYKNHKCAQLAFKFIRQEKPKSILIIGNRCQTLIEYCQRAFPQVKIISENIENETDEIKRNDMNFFVEKPELTIIEHSNYNDFLQTKDVIIFNTYLPKAKKTSENLWKSNQFNVGIDLFFVTFLFERKEQSKEFFLLRF